MAALATCHRQAGELGEAAALYGALYDLNEKANGSTNQSAVGAVASHVQKDVLRPRGWRACVRSAPLGLHTLLLASGCAHSPLPCFVCR